MSKSRLESHAVSRYAPACIGAALLVYLILHAGPRALLENVKLVGWGLLPVIALGGVSHVVKAWAWRLTLPREAPYPFSRMFGLRLVAEAIGQLGFPGVVAGEATRVTLLGSEVPLDSRILSVTLDRGLFIACGAIVTIAGITLGLAGLTLSHALRIYAVLFAAGFLSILCAAVLALSKGWPLLSMPARSLARVPHIGRWIVKKQSLISSVEEKLLLFHRERPSAFWGSVILNFTCHVLAIAEVYLIILFMGRRIPFISALILESFTKLINLIGSLTPGNVGVYEGGTMVIAGFFGLSGMAGLTLGLCRRARALFWAVVGGIYFFAVSRSIGPRRESKGSGSTYPAEKAPLNGTPSLSRGESCGKSTAAIIFIEGYDARGFSPELAHVGTLPVVLRAILQARGVNAERIIVAANPAAGKVIRRELLRSGRLPKTVEWFELDGTHRSLPQLIGQIAEDADRILLLLGDVACHPRLYQMLMEWDGQSEAIALTTGGNFVGAGALSRRAAQEIARACPDYVETPIELYAWAKPGHDIAFKEVEADLWHAVSTPQDRLAAERKLDQWLVKPTDGFFAQMNRKISVPISRELIKFPITPNMVTLFTLGVSFVAGVFFALGGYWNTLLGGLLSAWASILDGCDGEVARLKLQASPFGCWLETICDYLYYLFIFGGMSLGLAKSRGTDAYLVWGGFLFFGAVVSFLVVGWGRHRFASSQPERFLYLWQKKADKQKSNPLIYLARHTEFMTRRCFLPYALLAFAIVNLLRFAFIGTAVAANIVWIIASYSYWKLSPQQTSVPSVGKRIHRRQHVTSAVLLPAHDGD